MIALILAGTLAWFFAVDVDEFWYRHDTTPRAVGGWTHEGPFKTRAECERGRAVAQRMAYVGSEHWVRYIPRECRTGSLEEYRDILRRETARFLGRALTDKELDNLTRWRR